MNKNQLIGVIFISIGLSIAAMESSYAAQGIYVSTEIGVNKQPSVTYRNFTGDNFLKIHYKEGLVAGGAIGYQLDNYRVEGAFDWFNNRARVATMNAVLSKDNPGRSKVAAAMVNALYDFDAESEWTNYLGIGLGTMHIWHRIDIDVNNNVHSGANKFAYQGIAGVSHRFSEFVRANLDYRYLRSAPSTYTVVDAGTPIPMKGKYKNHRLTLSLTAFL